MSRADTPGHVSPAIRMSRVVTVMKADISGSTPLAEKLDPEDLRRVLGTYFAALAREIHWHGGTVDKYIGDAVLAAFGLPEPHPDDAERAVRAGLAMQRAIERENEALHARYGVRLACRIGLATGEVGGYPPTGERATAMFSVFGETVQRAEWLEAAAPLGGVLVSAPTRDASPDAFRYEEAITVSPKGGGPRIEAYRVLDAIRAGGGRAGTAVATTSASLQVAGAREHVLAEERKIVTVLFADLSSDPPISASLDQEQVRDVLGTYFGVLAREIQRFGGTLDKYVGDAVMAVFGAPISHEDDGARAIACALAIQDARRSLGDWVEGTHGVKIAIRIGINTGEVVAGMLPGEVHAYTVTGDAVNTAQRIESVAPPGDVLVSETTYALARKTFVFEPVAPLTLKGKATPVPAYRVVGRRRDGIAQDGVELVGRRAELARLEALLGEAIAGAGRIAHLHGEAGVGKSKLLAEFVTRMPPTVSRIAARSSSYESATPYALVADMLRGAFNIQIGESADAARDATVAALAPLELPSAASAADLVLEILGHQHETGMEPESKRRRLLALLRLYLAHRSALGTFVITAEDVHWIDTTSSTLFVELFADIPRLRCLFIATSRDELAPWPAIAIGLDTLGETDALQLIDRIATVPIDPAVRATILERTAGNPFFIEEVVRALARDRGGTVPATVQDLLEAKLDALDAEPRYVVQRASVIGRTFWTRVLERVSDRAQVRPALTVLEREHFVTPHELTPEETYAFRHALVQEVSYQTQLVAQRRRIHGVVGDAILELFPERADELVYLLAYHYRRSDDDVKARGQLLRAGARAHHLFAKDEALDYFRGALERSGDDPATQAAALEGIGGVLRFAGRWDEAISQYEHALDALGEGDPFSRSRLRVKIATIQRLRGDPATALATLANELAALPGDAHRDLAYVHLEVGRSQWQQGRFDDAILSLERAIAEAERAGAARAAANAYQNLGTVHVLKGDAEQGLRWYARGLRLFEEQADASGEANLLNNVGVAYTKQARYREALDALGRSLALKERLGDPRGISLSANNIANVRRLVGELDEAERGYRKALEQAELIGFAVGALLAHSGLGSTFLDRDDPKTAREHFDVELAESERLGRHADLAEPQRNIALTYLGEDRDAALAWAERALGSARAAGVAVQEGLALQTLGVVHRARGELAEAMAALDRSRALLEATPERHELGRTIAELGRAGAELPEGDPRRLDAAGLRAEARAIFAELGAALDLERLDADVRSAH